MARMMTFEDIEAMKSQCALWGITGDQIAKWSGLSTRTTYQFLDQQLPRTRERTLVKIKRAISSIIKGKKGGTYEPKSGRPKGGTKKKR